MPWDEYDEEYGPTSGIEVFPSDMAKNIEAIIHVAFIVSYYIMAGC
jgi:hypothetical protein